MLDQEVPGLSIKQQQIFTLLFHFNSWVLETQNSLF
jgi:hypothetical protein